MYLLWGNKEWLIFWRYFCLIKDLLQLIHTVIQHLNYLLADFRQNNACQISVILSPFSLTYCNCEFVTSMHFLCHNSGLTDTLVLKFSRKNTVFTENSLWIKSCCKKKVTLNRSKLFFLISVTLCQVIFKCSSFSGILSSFSVFKVNQNAKLTFDVQNQW